jgi:hypothetical protein
MSPGGCDVELVPLAALISKSAGGSGSRSADVGVSSADSSLSLNASRRLCKYAVRDLLGGLVVLKGGFTATSGDRGVWRIRRCVT